MRHIPIAHLENRKGQWTKLKMHGLFQLWCCSRSRNICLTTILLFSPVKLGSFRHQCTQDVSWHPCWRAQIGYRQYNWWEKQMQKEAFSFHWAEISYCQCPFSLFTVYWLKDHSGVLLAQTLKIHSTWHWIYREEEMFTGNTWWLFLGKGSDWTDQ